LPHYLIRAQSQVALQGDDGQFLAANAYDFVNVFESNLGNLTQVSQNVVVGSSIGSSLALSDNGKTFATGSQFDSVAVVYAVVYADLV
jgi:hypothetical protein